MIPTIDTALLTPDECSIVPHLTTELYHLHSLCEDLSAALKLLQFARESRIAAGTSLEALPAMELFTRWKFIAARDGAASVYKFGGTMEALGTNIGKMPTVKRLVDNRSRKMATSKYQRCFSDMEAVRHSNQHGGIHGTPEKWAQNIGESKVTMINSMTGDTLITTMAGREIRFTLNQQAVVNLQQVKSLYFDSLKPLRPWWAPP